MYNDKTLVFLSYKHGGIFLHQILLNHLVACNFKERLGAHIFKDITFIYLYNRDYNKYLLHDPY